MDENDANKLIQRLSDIENQQRENAAEAKRIAELDEIYSDIEELEKKINSIELKLATADVQSKVVRDKVQTMEDSIKWIVRLVVGAIVLALLGTVMKGGFDV